MKRPVMMAFLLAAATCWLFQSAVSAGDKKVDKKVSKSETLSVDGELVDADAKDKIRQQSVCKIYTFKMTEGKVYQIDMMSKDIDSYLRLEDAEGKQLAKDDDGGGDLNARIVYRAVKTADFQIIATTFGGGTGKFTLTVKEIALSKDAGKPIELKNDKGQAAYTGNLAADDARYKGQKLHKLFLFTMEERKTYQIDHMSKAFDCYMYLEDPDGKLLTQDDDGGEGFNSRIIHKAAKAGKYRIVATSLSGSAMGEFKLTVRASDADQPKDEEQCDQKNESPVPAQDARPIELKLDKSQAAEYKGELAAGDPLYKGKKLHKVFLYAMEAGKAYRIDHASAKFDAFLYLEDPAGKVVAENDDNGEGLDSRIVYTPAKAGTYRIIATSRDGNETGPFTLTVRLASADDVQLALLNKLVERFLVAAVGDPKEIVQEMTKYLESKGKKIGLADAGLAMQIAQVLESSKDEKAAAASMKLFAKHFAGADDPKVAERAPLLEGVARRLTLLGNEMEVKGTTLDGKAFDLKNLKGKVVLVDFWATWCGPCVGEIPGVKKMYNRYHKQGFEVIGISLDDSAAELKKFIAKEELPWGCIFDGDVRKGGSLTDQYGVIGIPLAILVGRDGRVLSMNARGEELTRLLEEMFDQKK